MLDLCDDLQRIRTRLADPQIGREERTRLRKQTQRRVEQLARNLANYEFRGPLGKRLREHRFTAREFEVLSLLLMRTVRSEEPAMEGRLILGSIFDTSFDVLSGMDLLHPDSKLRASGLVALEEGQEENGDVLESRFRLSEEALASFRAEVEGSPLPARGPSREARGYAKPSEFLIDLRLVHDLYHLRSERVLGGRGERAARIDRRSGRAFDRRIDEAWRRVRNRLASTERGKIFPSLRFLEPGGLDENETMIAVHLLFSEVYDGEAYGDIADLLRLISASEEDLLRSRRYLLPDAPLRARGILIVEPFLEGRDLTGEAHLADWVVNELLDLGDSKRRIESDERLDWHLYLKSLENSSGFFRELGEN
ncbi:MAG: hypothetical protein Fur0037_15990 [Planctomycetota bacterium]